MSIASPEQAALNVRDNPRWKRPETYEDLEFFAEQILPLLQENSGLNARHTKELGEIAQRISKAVVERGYGKGQDEPLPTSLQNDATRALLIFDCLEPEIDEFPALTPLEEISGDTRAPLENLMQKE